MAEEKIYVKGFRSFAKNPKAPSFVIGSLVIDVADFKDFINSNVHHLTEYNGNKQLKVQMLEGKEGKVTFVVDTYKPTPKTESTTSNYAPAANNNAESDLPF